MVLFRPLRLLQRLDEPLSILVHKDCLCSKIDRGSPSLCISLRGLSSTIQLKIDSSQPARACPWKFHNAAHTNLHTYLALPTLSKNDLLYGSATMNSLSIHTLVNVYTSALLTCLAIVEFNEI